MRFRLRPPPLFTFAGLLAIALPAFALAAPTISPPLPSGSRIEQLIAEAHALEPNEPARSVALAREALAAAQAAHDHRAKLRAATQLGQSLRLNNAYTEAEIVAAAALAQAGADADRPARGLLLGLQGQLAWNRADYPRAAALFLEVQRLADALGDKSLRIRACVGLGIVAKRQRDFPRAIELYTAGLAVAREEGDAEQELVLLNNLGAAYVDAGDFAQARTFFAANLERRIQRGDRRSIGTALYNLGDVEVQAGDLPRALDYYQRSLELRLRLGAPRHIAASRLSLARTLVKLGRTDEALAQLDAVAPAVAQLANHDLNADLQSAIRDVRVARGEYREALAAEQAYEKEAAAATGEATAKAVAELRERFDAEKRSREIAELRTAQERKDADLALRAAELRRARLQRYGLAALLALGAIAAAAIIGRQRALARAERRILADTRRARVAAEEAHALKSKLLDLASHDLKAPLVGVMMTADTIADDTTDRPAVADRARALRAESQRMFQLVQDLLDSSALETGQLALQRAPLDLAALAREIAAEFAPRLARKQQRLALSADTACPVDADAARLRQVIENLVDNAAKFSPAGSTVSLSVSRVGDTARLAVRDEGPGLTDEDRQNLFQRFRRLSAAPTAGEPSTGLGLALAHDLLVQHGGRLWAESTPGAGATFFADLPGAAPSPSAA